MLTVWHYDGFLPCNDVLGEVLLSVMHIPQMSTRQTIEDMPAMLLSLKIPDEPVTGPYQVGLNNIQLNTK